MSINFMKPRASIYWKLTGFFMLFGLAISGFILVSGVRTTAGATLRILERFARGAFLSSFEDRDAAMVRALSGGTNEPLVRLRSRFPALHEPATTPKMTVYARESGGAWVEFTEGKDGYLHYRLADARTERYLQRAPQRSGFLPLNPFSLPGHPVHAVLGLPDGPDGTLWALGVRVETSDILQFVSENDNEVILFLAALCVLSLALGRFFAWRVVRPLSNLAVSAEGYGRGSVPPAAFDNARLDEIGVLGRTLGNMARQLESARKQTEYRLSTMESMNAIDRAVLLGGSREDLLTRVASVIADATNARSAFLALRDETKSGWTLEALASRDRASPGRIPEAAPFLSDTLLDPASTYYLARKSVLSLPEAGASLRSLVYDITKSEEGWLANEPLTVDSRYLGSLVVVLGDGSPPTEEERRTLSLLADQAAVAVRSVLESEAREDNFVGVLRSLTRAIDAKSKWTAGHSERVADLAVSLGKSLGWPQVDLARLHIAGLLHDAGKIGIREAVLDKPGALTPEEYCEMKQHPVVGADLLEGIKSFEQVIPAVLRHHERWDGSGYPGGLAGTAIPEDARILAFADVWDAVSSERPYRARLLPDAARAFMRENSGSMFEPGLVEAFLAEAGQDKNSPSA